MLFTKPTAAETRAPAVHLPDYPLFDWLRFVLASAVALGHAGVITWHQSGNLAVQVFFALSGWLIGGILLRTTRSDLPRFFFNRATRIWIPYFCAVALLYAVSALRDPVTWRWVEFLFYDLTFTHNWFSLRPDAATALAEMPLRGTGNHFWSIAVEEQFYLLAPLLVLFAPFGRSPIFWGALSAVLLAAQIPDFASISLGVLASTLQTRAPDWHLRWTLALDGATILFGCGLLFVSYPLAAPLFAICVVLIFARPGKRSEIGQFFGGVSYPMYLNHWIGAFVVHSIAKRTGLPVDHLLTGLAAYALGVLAGAGAYLLVDRNVLANRGRYFSNRTGIILAGAAYALVLCGLAIGALR